MMPGLVPHHRATTGPSHLTGASMLGSSLARARRRPPRPRQVEPYHCDAVPLHASPRNAPRPRPSPKQLLLLLVSTRRGKAPFLFPLFIAVTLNPAFVPRYSPLQRSLCRECGHRPPLPSVERTSAPPHCSFWTRGTTSSRSPTHCPAFVP
jgi:hypothetical protein